MPPNAPSSTSQRMPAWAAQGVKKGRRQRTDSKQNTQLVPSRRQPHTKGPTEDSHGIVSADDALQFQFHGHVTLRSLLDSQTMSDVKVASSKIIQRGELHALRHSLKEQGQLSHTLPYFKQEFAGTDISAITSIAAAKQVLESAATEPVGFLQFFHSRTAHACIQRLACGPVLSTAAAVLLGCDKVRLYQDCLFYKRPGMDVTNWHSDVRLTPLDTNAFVTFWIPLRPIKAQNDSGLMFARGSHRDMAGLFWRGQEADLSQRGYKLAGTEFSFNHGTQRCRMCTAATPHKAPTSACPSPHHTPSQMWLPSPLNDSPDAGPMQLGDVSAHHGWTLHMAAEQQMGSQPRAALAISYFAEGATLLDLQHDGSVRAHLHDNEDQESYESWVRGLKAGRVVRHKDLPLVYDGRWTN